ncbi:MAG: hypothetical protein ACLUW8_09705 [Subdoligranulum sp.]
MKFDKKEAAGQPLPFSAPKNPQWVMLAALLLSYAAGYEYVDRCLGFGVASEYSAWRAGVLVFVALYTVVVELAAWAGGPQTQPDRRGLVVLLAGAKPGHGGVEPAHGRPWLLAGRGVALHGYLLCAGPQ